MCEFVRKIYNEAHSSIEARLLDQTDDFKSQIRNNCEDIIKEQVYQYLYQVHINYYLYTNSFN